MTRKNFSFRYEWQQAIADLDPEIRLEIYEQTINYAATGKACFKSGIAAIAFNTHILPDFERREKAAAYRAKRKARMEAAKAETNTDKPDISEEPAQTDKTENTDKPAGTFHLNRQQRRQLQAMEKRLAKKRLRHAQGGAMPADG